MLASPKYINNTEVHEGNKAKFKGTFMTSMVFKKNTLERQIIYAS